MTAIIAAILNITIATIAPVDNPGFGGDVCDSVCDSVGDSVGNSVGNGVGLRGGGRGSGVRRTDDAFCIVIVLSVHVGPKVSRIVIIDCAYSYDVYLHVGGTFNLL